MAKKTAGSKSGKSNQPRKSAKPKLTASPRAASKKPVIGLTSRGLVAAVTPASTSANINVTFTSGIGQLTASLFRNGVLINLQSVSSSSTIFLADVQQGDTISINGVCTGNATIAISVPTDPMTPENFAAGNINTGYDVL